MEKDKSIPQKIIFTYFKHKGNSLHFEFIHLQTNGKNCITRSQIS